MQPSKLPPLWEEMIRQSKSRYAGQPRQVELRTEEPDTLQFEQLHKRFVQVLQAAKDAKQRADEAPESAAAACKADMVARLNELERIKNIVQNALNLDEIAKNPSHMTKTSLTSFRGALKEHRTVAGELRKRLRTLEEVVAEETRNRNSSKVLAVNTSPPRKNNADESFGDETLCLINYDLDALKMDLVKLEKQKETPATQPSPSKAPADPCTYTEGLERLRERLNRLEKPLIKHKSTRNSVAFRGDSTLGKTTTIGATPGPSTLVPSSSMLVPSSSTLVPRSSTLVPRSSTLMPSSSTIVRPAPLPKMDENNQNDINTSTLRELDLRKVAEKDRQRAATYNIEPQPAPAPVSVAASPEVDIADELLSHPGAKESLRELQRLSVNRPLTKTEDFDGSMLWVRRGKWVKRWRQRYATIMDHRFFGNVLGLFKYEDGAVDGSKSRLVVLRNTRCTNEGQIMYEHEHRYVFKLRSSKKEYWFMTPSSSKRDEWLRRLRVAQK